MEYEIQYDNYRDTFVLIFDSIIVNIRLNRKYHNVEIRILKKENVRREKIDLSKYFEEVINFFNKQQLLCKKDNSDFKEDILKLDNIKYLELSCFKLEQRDIEIISTKFKNLRVLTTEKCTFYNNCNLGILKCDIIDNYSDIHGLDIFNGFEGKLLSIKESNIKSMNRNVLHLNNIVTIFRGIDMDYEYFFLTTDAPKMRKIEIHGDTKLTDNDLLFISGFYNLESVDIDAFVSSYEQLEKLEKLRKISGIYCLDDENLKIVKSKQKKYFEKLLYDNVTESRIKNFLMNNRLVIQNEYQDFFYKLYVPRLERVKWESKINNNNLQQIKKHLLEIENMNSSERKNISREPKKEYTLFDETFGLYFDKHPSLETEIIENDSRPFQDGGIRYYSLRKKIYLEK